MMWSGPDVHPRRAGCNPRALPSPPVLPRGLSSSHVLLGRKRLNSLPLRFQTIPTQLQFTNCNKGDAFPLRMPKSHNANQLHGSFVYSKLLDVFGIIMLAFEGFKWLKASDFSMQWLWNTHLKLTRWSVMISTPKFPHPLNFDSIFRIS